MLNYSESVVIVAVWNIELHESFTMIT